LKWSQNQQRRILENFNQATGHQPTSACIQPVNYSNEISRMGRVIEITDAKEKLEAWTEERKRGDKSIIHTSIE
jgi:hypothetical protein